MTTKTIANTTKTVAKLNAKATKAPATIATKKNATVAKPTAKKSKPAGKKLSQIEAAIQILSKSKDPMNCMTMVEAMQVHGLWSTPGGATPGATLVFGGRNGTFGLLFSIDVPVHKRRRYRSGT